MVTKAAVCCPARERWAKNGHQRGRLMIESRAMGQKWSSKRPFAARLESDGVRMVTKAAVCCPARERWGKNGHQRGRLMIESRAIG
ncbi:hypothetical protein [Falsibacillus albus]|uniref:Uncharacterized protein n=1 Tax=Falsibacillus albus TaxID=2478915 RepID=A0A3L7K2I7_9BACI|nr:hypothetical protein [Falsibacillus albus]RLQ97223.1 hypothetical protein D9X91_03465 [Falsibacillus albus]